MLLPSCETRIFTQRLNKKKLKKNNRKAARYYKREIRKCNARLLVREQRFVHNKRNKR